MEIVSKISDLIGPEDIPGDLGLFEAELQTALSKLYYRHFAADRSRTGDAGHGSLLLYFDQRLGWEVPGSGGLELAVNPAAGGNGSEFGFRWWYRLPIRAFFPAFSIEAFAGNPRSYFDVLVRALGCSAVDLIDGLLRHSISGGNPLQTFVDRYNAAFSPHIALPADPGVDARFALLAQLDAAQRDLFEVVFSLFIDQGTLQQRFDQLRQCLRTVCADLDFDAVLRGFKPAVRVEATDLVLALRFPRKYLLPLDANDAVIPENHPTLSDRAELRFTAGNVRYSSGDGLEFDALSQFSLTPSEIGHTGLRLSVTDLRVDLSRTKNLPEARADGRPVDFIGAYITEAEITLSAKWFKNQNGNPLGIYARNLLVGTGGISGKIGLEVVGSPGVKPTGGAEMLFTLGKKNDNDLNDNRQGFALGFSKFEMEFQQNQIVRSEIRGSLTIPKFKQCGQTDPLRVELEAFFQNNGDFSFAAKPDNELKICFGDVFILYVHALEVGRSKSKVFLDLSCDLSFEENSRLKDILKTPISLKNFIIHSDGSFELPGGAIPLPDSARISLGPADNPAKIEISITAIHFGAHEQELSGEMRKYKYFGFDGGVSVNPGGVDARGEGCKYYFTVDDDDANGKPHDSFLRIEGIAIDLIIPGNATKETANLLIQGYLSLKAGEYQGSVKFQAPQARIAGGAAMSYKPDIPAFLVDAQLDMASPLPLGNTGLGIFGFRGLFGLRYLADKSTVNPDAATWYDYFKAKDKGVNSEKFLLPEDTASASTPISIAAGISLATLPDDGKAFSSQLMLLISIPSLILLEGKANVMGKRLGLLDSSEAPFTTMISYSPGDSVEIGIGANYKLPREGAQTGLVARLTADIHAAYFFQDSKAWYVHIGTKSKPINARLFDLLVL